MMVDQSIRVYGKKDGLVSWTSSGAGLPSSVTKERTEWKLLNDSMGERRWNHHRRGINRVGARYIV